MSEQCPQCGGSDSTLRARQAWEGDPPAVEVAPPAAPPVTGIATAEARWNPTTRTVALIVGGYLALALVAVLVAGATGVGVGAVLAGVPLPGLGFWVVLYLARGRDPLPAANAEQVSFHKVVWTRRMQVWEHAWFCSACRVAFWPAGALKPAFPASPAVPPHEFPLMVATMADRAYAQA
ncbi:hypothetical protein ACGFX4_28260 [Kitasatospora sp. NPDC048365]|uniref:hypothetical protein n=1 Tax=Kitasatospora sp. NPDC048365 TaxID=3364050 RepID=UPI00371D9437